MLLELLLAVALMAADAENGSGLGGLSENDLVYCDTVECPHGGCKFENCRNSVSCSGGKCTMINCVRPTCDGGVCTFDGCVEPLCKGGLCEFFNTRTTLGHGYCTGGLCKIEGIDVLSNMGDYLAS